MVELTAGVYGDGIPRAASLVMSELCAVTGAMVGLNARIVSWRSVLNLFVLWPSAASKGEAFAACAVPSCASADVKRNIRSMRLGRFVA